MIKSLHFLLSAVASLSSAKFIPVVSCISSIHFFLGRPCFLLPSPYANIISFSNPSDRMTCPKNLNFALSTVCCSVSSFSIPISMRTQSLVLFSIHDILCIFLHIHISHALIFFFHFLGHCPCLTAVCYCWYDQSLHQSLFRIYTHMFVFPYFFQTIHCSFSYRHPTIYFHITLSLFFYY